MAYTDSATRNFEHTVKNLFRALCKEPFEGPLKVELECFFQRPKKTDFAYPPRGDCDNFFKSVADAGNEILWHDDAQIVRLICTKKWSTEDGFRITVSEYLD